MLEEDYREKVVQRLKECFREALIAARRSLEKNLSERIEQKKDQWIYTLLFEDFWRRNKATFWLALTSSMESTLGGRIEKAVVAFVKHLQGEETFPWKVEVLRAEWADLVLRHKGNNSLYVIELKLGGNLDSKNRQANVQRINQIAQQIAQKLNHKPVPVIATLMDQPAVTKKLRSGVKQEVVVWSGEEFWSYLLFGTQGEGSRAMQLVRKAYSQAALEAKFEKLFQKYSKVLKSCSRSTMTCITPRPGRRGPACRRGGRSRK
ncbi:MAG: hypothetical protein ABDH20_09410 [Thermus sp.]